MSLAVLDRIFKHKNERPEKNVYIFQNKTFEVFDKFIASNGEEIPLLKGFREHIKSGWEAMLAPNNLEFKAPDDETSAKRVLANIKKVRELSSFLNARGISFKNKTILEVGCFAGATTFSLSLLSPKKIIGSDLSRYYIYQTVNNQVNQENINKQFIKLTKERQHLKQHIIKNKMIDLCGNIEFIEDDINDSKLDDKSADLIISYEVMEHVQDPEKTIGQMRRLLAPGGYMFHEYNPFFCLEGGHSLCTLDFPWGHTRLTPEDFIRYTNTYRQNEASVDQSFFFNNLNRMTMEDLKTITEKNGFEIIEMITWSKDLLKDLLKDPSIFKQSKNIKENLKLSDLLTNKVWALMRRTDK